MGYYDDHMRPQRHNKGWLMPSLVGLILGAILVLLALPILAQANLLPYDIAQEDESNNQADQNETDPEGSNKTVNVEVNTQITDIVDNVSNAVVGVVNIKQQSMFGDSSNQQDGVGSGVIYKVTDEDAFIVTNYHVIQNADDVEIALSQDEQVAAEVIGGDLYTDLAVVRMDAEHAEQVAELGSSENLRVGEPVIAIGNPLGLQFAGSVTQGIISGKDRVIPQDFSGDGQPDWQSEVIQTDAAINPGNSGGALVNLDGQLIGINSMKYASAQLEGLGFAIPIDIARPIIADLEEDGTLTRSYMGVSIFSLTDVAQYHWENTLNLPNDVQGGVVVERVERMSPAAQAGLEQYDVIVQMNDQEITNVLELRQFLFNQSNPGDEVTIEYYRNGELQQTTITLVAQE